MNLLNYLATHPSAFIAVVILFTLLIGSFLNVVIYRLPLMLKKDWVQQANDILADEEFTRGLPTEQPFNLSKPDSRCPSCGHQIRAWENIPVVSYLMLRGRCAQCKTRISMRYPLVEAATALLSAVVAMHFGWSWEALAALALTWCLIALTLIDFDTTLLPDNITLPLLWAGLLVNAVGLFPNVSLTQALWGAVAGYLSLWLVFHGFRLLTGKEGMGYGDFKLFAALGAWMGWQALPMIILLSSLVGAVVGISLILFRGQDRNIPIPFGPYLAAAGWIALLWGEDITLAYLRFAGLT